MYSAFVYWLLFIGCLALFALLYQRMRLKSDKKNTQLRSDIVADLHDDLGGRLYAIKIIADQIGDPTLQSDRKEILTQNLKALAESSIQVIRNLMWSFKIPNHPLEALVNKLQDFSTTTIEPLIPHQITVSISTALLQKTIDSQNANRILMSLQEILINMLKHTQPERMETQIDLKGNTLEIRICNHLLVAESQDTNYLTPQQPSTKTYGLENITQRIRLLKGTFRFDTDLERQYCELSIPLKGF